MARRPKTRAPALSPELVQYYRARASLKRNIRRFRGLSYSEHGAKWIASQTAYWERRLAELEATAPPGAVDY